jgi:hypothetical protein
MTRDDLALMVDPERVQPIMEVASDVSEYLELDSVLKLGLTIHHSEFDFDKIMIFSWIREEIDSGREHRLPTKGNRRSNR